MTKHQLFGALALVLALFSPFISGAPFLLLAVILLAIAVLMIGL